MLLILIREKKPNITPSYCTTHRYCTTVHIHSSSISRKVMSIKNCREKNFLLLKTFQFFPNPHFSRICKFRKFDKKVTNKVFECWYLICVVNMPREFHKESLSALMLGIVGEVTNVNIDLKASKLNKSVGIYVLKSNNFVFSAFSVI